MRRFRLWLARKLVGSQPFMANMFIKDGALATGPPPVWHTTSAVTGYFDPGTLTGTVTTTRTPNASVLYAAHEGGLFNFKDGEVNLVAKKKKRTKAAGKAAAKNKQENKAKAKGGKGAR